MPLSVLIGCARCPLVEEIDACICQDRQAKMHSDTDRGHILLITRYSYTLCKGWISPKSYLCIYNKNCRQANGDNRHLVPDVPTGLDRDIRDMPIACARTHTDANKHARHIPMYRPVHSAHANKCSRCGKVDIYVDETFLFKLFFLGFFSVCLPNIYFNILEYLSTLDLLSFDKSDS